MFVSTYVTFKLMVTKPAPQHRVYEYSDGLPETRLLLVPRAGLGLHVSLLYGSHLWCTVHQASSCGKTAGTKIGSSIPNIRL